MTDIGKRTAGRIVVPLLLGSVFLLPYLGGGFAAYLQLLLALVLVVWVLVLPAPWRSEGAGLLGLVAFLTLLTVFTITNPPGRADFLYAANFAVFLFLGPLIAALSQFAAPRNTLLVARLALIGALLAAAVAAWQHYALGLETTGGIGTNRITSAGAATVLAFMSMLGFVVEKSRIRWVYFLGPLLAIGIVYLGASRGPLLVLAALFAALAFSIARRKIVALLAFVAVATLAVAALLLFPSAFGRLARLPAILLGVFDGSAMPDHSATLRLRLYRAGVRAFLNSPWIGHGWGEKARATWPDRVNFKFDRDKWHLHSDILDFAVSGGLAGLAAYGMLLAAPIVGAVRSVRDSQRTARILGATLLTTGYVAYGAFNLAFGFEYLTTLYAMLAAILIGWCRDAPLHS